MLKSNIEETFLELKKKDLILKSTTRTWEFWPRMTNNKIHMLIKLLDFFFKRRNILDTSAKTVGGL